MCFVAPALDRTGKEIKISVRGVHGCLRWLRAGLLISTQVTDSWVVEISPASDSTLSEEFP